jgi:hypothetical protein
MTSRLSLAATLALGLAAIPAAAQTREIQNEVNLKLAEERARLAGEQVRADRQQASRERYEEIEIMARLLDRSIDQLAGIGFHDGVHAVAFSPDGDTLATSSDGGFTGTVRLWDVHTGKRIAGHPGADLTAMQGVYLKGQGIVFSMTAPLHFQRPIGGPDKPAAKPLTEWERVRRELRGEQTEPVNARETTDTSIADAILKVLADNGKNLSHLPEDENVTVALTLLQAPACTACHASSGGGGPMRGPMGSGMTPGSGGAMGPGMGSGRMGGPGMGYGMGPPGKGAGGPGAMGPGPRSSGPGGGGGPGVGSAMGGGPAGDGAGALADFRKYALMGDLALKQNDYIQAVEQYRKAAAVRMAPTDSAIALEHVEVATKLARALMAVGKSEEAERVVADVRRLAQNLKDGQKPDKRTEAKAEVALPAKLVITVPKRVFTAIGTGAVSATDIRKGASVEYLTFDKP